MDDLERFEALLGRAERLRVSSLDFEELRELGRHYRLATARLARLRHRVDDPETTHHLNSLTVRAYSLLYRSRETAATPVRPFSERLAGAVAQTWHVQVAAWLLLLLGGVVGAGLTIADDRALYSLMPSSLGYSDTGLERLVRSSEARAEFLARESKPVAVNAVFGASLFANNTRVGLLAFAAGILAGVPTVLLQVYNGLLLGALSSVFLRDPWPLDFAAWILPHGIPELTAIALCGAAGLRLGLAVANPGRRGRRRALRDALDPTLLLVAASLPLFALAAGVESFVRESELPTSLRLTVATVFAFALAGGLATVHEVARRRRPEVAWLDELNPLRGWR